MKWQLLGKLIGESGSYVTPTTEGKVPKPIQKKINSYRRGPPRGFVYAEHEILSMIAAADLMWEKKVRPLFKQNENALLQTLGANLFSATDTARSQRQTKVMIQKLDQLKTMCSTFPTLASAVIAKSAMAGPANASQIGFNTHGRDTLKKKCVRNAKAIDAIVERLHRIELVNYRP
jgi:hypothetical protein